MIKPANTKPHQPAETKPHHKSVIARMARSRVAPAQFWSAVRKLIA